jgi:hypothetical protein
VNSLGVENRLYDVADPRPGLLADFAEQLWQQYECARIIAVAADVDNVNVGAFGFCSSERRLVGLFNRNCGLIGS